MDGEQYQLSPNTGINMQKNRAKYRFKYMGNPNSAVTFEDFNKIDWHLLLIR